MSWTANDIPDLTGRTAVVTGANGGLGLETARALAGAGAHVVMAARDQEKARAAEKSIRESHPGASSRSSAWTWARSRRSARRRSASSRPTSGSTSW